MRTHLALLIAVSTFTLARSACPTIISRDEWGARPPVAVTPIDDLLPYMFVHHAACCECYDVESCKEQVRSIQNYHMDDPDHLWNDIGYSFLIGNDGSIFEGRGWNVQGAHTGGYNTVGYGTCFLGNFMDVEPSQTAIDAYFQLLQCAVDELKIVSEYTLYGHRQVGSTLCPGDLLYDKVVTWPHWSGTPPLKHD